jgi:hypothetical protein
METVEKIDLSTPDALAEFLETHVPQGGAISLLVLLELVNRHSATNQFSRESIQTALAKTRRFVVRRGAKGGPITPGDRGLLRIVRG